MRQQGRQALIGFALLFLALLIGFALVGCIAATTDVPTDEYALQEGVLRSDSAVGVVLLIRTDGRDAVRREWRYPARWDADSVAASLDRNLKALDSLRTASLVHYDSLLRHTRILRDLYRKQHE